MSFEERGAWSAILSGVIVFFLFGRPIWQGTVDGTYGATDGLTLWAWDVIWLIGGGVVVAIVVLIGLQILYAIVTGTGKPQFLSDERDFAINTRGAVVTLVVISGGFLISVTLLAMGWSALAALNTILIGMSIGAIASEVYRIAVYRLGL